MNNLLTYWEEYLLELNRFPSMPIHDLVLLVLDQHPTIIWHSIEEISSQIKRDTKSIRRTIEALLKSRTIIQDWRIYPSPSRYMYASKARHDDLEHTSNIRSFENKGGLCEKHADSEFVINPVTWTPQQKSNEEMAFREADSDHPMYQKRDDKPSSDLPPLNTNPFAEVEATLLRTLSIVQNAENLNKAISQLKLEGEKLHPCCPQS